MPGQPIITTEAWLWNGHRRLSGQLLLFAGHLQFEQVEFPDSHLSLTIPLAEIMEMEEFLLFGLARNGLLIRSRSGRQDLFVLNSPANFRRQVEVVRSDL